MMNVITINKQDWARGLDRAYDSYRLFGPVKQDEFHNFRELVKGELPDLKLLNTRLSAKSLVYPQSEKLFDFTLDESREDHHILKEIHKDYSPRAIIGIRPCDAKAFLLVKANFDTPEYKDPYWIQSYEATTFVGYACNTPCSTCFCTTAGCGPFSEQGLDLLLVDAEDHYLLKIITQKGEKFLNAAGWSSTADSDAASHKIETMKQAAEENITAGISTDKLKDKKTTELFEAPFWEQVTFACINCGTCTYVCPTCWCFDIQDETLGFSGIRLRNWDSCMYPLFTLHGSGHNPRNTNMKRVRQRFMHKLKYYVDKYGNGIQCVGCGRCIRHCPVNIDIRKVCDLMNSYEALPLDS
jgi:sulfhydrogenase subunit beta (sulfur reductase)